MRGLLVELLKENPLQFRLDLSDPHLPNFVERGDSLFYVDEGGVGDVRGVGLANLLKRMGWFPGARIKGLSGDLVRGYQSCCSDPVHLAYLHVVSALDRIYKVQGRDLSTGKLMGEIADLTDILEGYRVAHLFETIGEETEFLNSVPSGGYRSILYCKILDDSVTPSAPTHFLYRRSEWCKLRSSSRVEIDRKLCFPKCFGDSMVKMGVSILHVHGLQLAPATMALKERLNVPLVLSPCATDDQDEDPVHVLSSIAESVDAFLVEPRDGDVFRCCGCLSTKRFDSNVEANRVYGGLLLLGLQL